MDETDEHERRDFQEDRAENIPDRPPGLASTPFIPGLFFPTLADLSGLLNASIGSIIGESQLEQLRAHRGHRHRRLTRLQQQPGAQLGSIIEASSPAEDLVESWNEFYDTLPPASTEQPAEDVAVEVAEEKKESSKSLNLTEKGEGNISEHQIIPSTLDAFITLHQQERSYSPNIGKPTDSEIE